MWYSDVQRSFLEPIRNRNLNNRYITEAEIRRLAQANKVKDPEKYLPEFYVVMDLRDGFECFLNNFKNLICVNNLPSLAANGNVSMNMDPLQNIMNQKDSF